MSFLSQYHHHITGNFSASRKLVFLHGLMGYGANWRRIAKAFEHDFHILYYDQRGHGRSISPPSGYAPEDFAGDLKQIVDELGWSTIHLVGHSMGGRSAAHFAYRYPEGVERLVIEDIGPDAHPQAIAKIEALLDGIPAPFAQKRAAKEYFMNDFPRQFADRPQVHLLGQFLYSNFSDQPSGCFDWRFDKEVMRACVREGRTRDRFDEFAALSCPTLLLRGQQSEELRPAVYRRLLAENSQIQGVEIDPAGHWIHYDQPELFSQKVREFFESANRA